MKYVLGTLCFLFSISSNCQMTKSLFCYNKLQSDSILNYFLNTKDSIKINRNCIVLNINYTDLSEKTNNNSLFKHSLLLDRGDVLMFIFDTIQLKALFAVGIDERNNEFHVGYSKPIDKITELNLCYLLKLSDISKMKLFKLNPPLNELYVLIDNKLFIVAKGKLYNPTSYLRKKYKNENTFINKYKKTLIVN